MKRQKTIRHCKICGAAVERFLYSPEPANGTFCSLQCKQSERLIEKQCRRCGKLFKTVSKRKIQCSHTCRKEPPKCKGCGKDCDQKKSWCSRECRRQTHRAKHTRNCIECGKVFFRKFDGRNASANSHKYCGQTCYCAARAKNIERREAARQARKRSQVIDRKIARQLARITQARSDLILQKITAAVRRNECRGDSISIRRLKGGTIEEAITRLERKRLNAWSYKIGNKLSNAQKRLKQKAYQKKQRELSSGNCAKESNVLAGDAN